MVTNGPSPAGVSIIRLALVAAPRFLLGVLIFVGIGINFSNIVARYVFSTPFVWAEEILTYIMIWCVFIGAVVVTWEGRHIKMDLITAALRSPWREVINAFVLTGTILVCAFVILQSWTVVSLFFQTGQETVIARLPAGAMHASILVGFSGMLVVVLLRWRSYLHGDFGSDAEAMAQQLMDVYGETKDEVRVEHGDEPR